MPSAYSSRRHYKEAMFDKKPSLFSSRISAAEKAIHARIAEIYSSGHDASTEETEAIVDALRGLQLLQQFQN